MDDFQHAPPTPGSVAVILPAAGSGSRFGSHQNKLFATLGDQPLWFHAARRLRECSLVGRIVMPVSAEDQSVFNGEYADKIEELNLQVVLGGAERTDSVQMGLETLKGDDSVALVAIHDAARPLVLAADLLAVFASAWQTGAAILATPMTGTVKRSSNLQSTITVDRRQLWIALTPQVFRIERLREAYRKYRGRPATDDAELVERIGHPVAIVKGSADNIKITLPEDLIIAEAILAKQNNYG